VMEKRKIRFSQNLDQGTGLSKAVRVVRRENRSAKPIMARRIHLNPPSRGRISVRNSTFPFSPLTHFSLDGAGPYLSPSAQSRFRERLASDAFLSNPTI
jgi:hypothetical protein